jgi:predicted enzyme related to lactoylglutathione lyase
MRRTADRLRVMHFEASAAVQGDVRSAGRKGSTVTVVRPSSGRCELVGLPCWLPSVPLAAAHEHQIGQSRAVTHLDHLTIFVREHRVSASWYVQNLGFEVEFETPDGATTAIRDDRDFTIFLTNRATTDEEPRCILYFEVSGVDATYQRLASNGVEVTHGPRDNPWGYGPEIRDPDRHAIRLWDARSVT